MKVEDLLNPVPKEHDQHNHTTTPAQAQAQAHAPERPILPPLQTHLPPMQRPTKQKLPKDAPIFRKGPTKGEVVFAPHEAGDDKDLADQYERYQIFPRGEIAEYCHHIPYSSDKKTFLSKTGRDAFEVFQYTFRLPGEDREYVVMWDYNIGLVRITPFFKCCKYSKTTPAKVLNMNPGLRDITHSITGGALTAQGYWMPYACARAVAATFCHDLRHALVPLFGKEFLDVCVPPNDAMFGNFKIDPAIIKACTVETQKWLQRADARFTPGSSREASEAPGTPQSGSIMPWKKIRPRLLGSAASPESGYETGTEASEGTPNLSPQSAWATINKPRAGTPLNDPAEVTAATSLLMLSSPKTQSTPFGKEIPRSVSCLTTPEKRDAGKRAHEELEDSEPSDEDKASIGEVPQQAARPVGCHVAALTLLQMRAPSAIDADSGDEHREKRQRCSSVP